MGLLGNVWQVIIIDLLHLCCHGSINALLVGYTVSLTVHTYLLYLHPVGCCVG